MFTKEFFNHDRNNLFLAAVIAALVVLPVLIYGVPYGADMQHHYQCALTYLEAFKSGEFYPSWTLNRNLGYGALELRMYPPLSHYVLAVFQLIFNDWHLATWANYSFWWMLGGAGVYLFAREFVKPPSALVASALFSVMPYRLSELYLTFIYSELCAIAVLPFCFLFLTRTLKETDQPTALNRQGICLTNALGFSVSYAVLILTHLPLTVIGTLSLGIYFLAQVRWNIKPFVTAFLELAGAVVCALSATSFLWTKVLQERFLMAKNDIYPEFNVEYQNNFLVTFLQSYDGIRTEMWDIVIVYDVILLITLIVVLPLGVAGFYSRAGAKRRRFRGIWATLVVTIFLTTIFSSPIWNHSPFLYEVQFPWRFLSVISIFSPVLAAAGFPLIIEWLSSEKRKIHALTIVGAIKLALLFAILQCVNGAIYKSSSVMSGYVEEVGTAKGFTFWWTIWTKKEIFDHEEKVSEENRLIQIQKWTATEREFSVSAGEVEKMRVSVFYHPNWKATINEIPAETQPGDDGALIISLPKQFSSVRIFFQENFSVIIARWISGFTWLFLAGIFFYSFQRRTD